MKIIRVDTPTTPITHLVTGRPVEGYRADEEHNGVTLDIALMMHNELNLPMGVIITAKGSPRRQLLPMGICIVTFEVEEPKVEPKGPAKVEPKVTGKVGEPSGVDVPGGSAKPKPNRRQRRAAKKTAKKESKRADAVDGSGPS